VRLKTAHAAALLLAIALPTCQRLNEDPSPSPSGFPAGCGAYPHRITTIKTTGGRVDWSHANGRIAYDRPGDDGYFDVYVMAADGTGDVCLTCGNPAVPQKNNGNPTWHSSGNFIVFQSEVADSRALQFSSNPGRGLSNVLWASDAAGREFTQLTQLSSTEPVLGVLHPHFSADGGRLSWSEMYEATSFQERQFFGLWRLVVADFVVTGGRPALRNLRKFEPGSPAFYENHGFSPDGSRLLFSSNFVSSGIDALNNDIFTMDLNSLAVTRLTTDNYNEHAQFLPSGRKIDWITNRDVPTRGTDIWIMNPDGSGKERLTFLNQAGCPEYVGERTVPADNSPNAAGNKIVVYVQDEVLGSRGSIMLVEFDRSF
jgi:Tol biopolymer transport system component